MTASGVDIGSVAAKAVVLADGGVAGRGMAPTGADPAQAAETALAKALEAAGAERASVSRLVATGYGRRATRLSGEVVTEISAAARGAFWLGAPWGHIRVVADLGGQDTKVIVLDAAGNVADFAMNDRCAAGTGRFLSLMAACLEMDLSEMARLSLQSQSPVALNSTCAVFAESEVISLIAQGKKKKTSSRGCTRPSRRASPPWSGRWPAASRSPGCSSWEAARGMPGCALRWNPRSADRSMCRPSRST